MHSTDQPHFISLICLQPFLFPTIIFCLCVCMGYPLRFCMEHRQSAMIDVLDRHCRERGCDRQPIYGNPHQMTGKPSWCPSHRPQNSFDVKTSRCQDPSCSKHPRFVPVICLVRHLSSALFSMRCVFVFLSFARKRNTTPAGRNNCIISLNSRILCNKEAPIFFMFVVSISDVLLLFLQLDCQRQF